MEQTNQQGGSYHPQLPEFGIDEQNFSPAAAEGYIPDAAGFAAGAAVPANRNEAEPAGQELMHRISTASATALGQVATIEAVGHEDADTEVDTFPWIDAATWSADDQEEELQLDECFAAPPDEELGERHGEYGWFGLLRHDGRPGGKVRSQNGYGRRQVWSTESDEELHEHWERLKREHEAYVLATDRRSSEEDGSGPNPEIWVASLSDYNNGRLHGVWLDATLDPDELHDAVQFMLRNGYERDAEEWAIFDYDGFSGGVASLLGEYASLEVVSRIAKGIQVHGDAFAAWAAHAGIENEELVDRFEDYFLGEYESAKAYAEHLLEESEAYKVLDEAPEGLRPYLKLDAEGYARDLEIEMNMVEKPDGGVWVFDPRG